MDFGSFSCLPPFMQSNLNLDIEFNIFANEMSIILYSTISLEEVVVSFVMNVGGGGGGRKSRTQLALEIPWNRTDFDSL